MFERIRYRREFEVLPPLERNQQLQTLLSSLPINPFRSEVEDFSETKRFIEKNKRKLGVESLETISPSELFELHLVMLQEHRLASPERQIFSRKLTSLLKFARVSPYFRNHITEETSTYFTIGIYDNPDYLASDDADRVDIQWVEFKGLLFGNPEEAGLFDSTSGLEIERMEFARERRELGNSTANLWSQGIDAKRVLGNATHRIETWKRSFSKYHKIQS